MELDDVDREIPYLLREERSAERDRLAADACSVSGVVQTRGLLNGSDNLQIEAVGTADIARISDGLAELGLDVVNSKIRKSTRVQPFDRFGRSVVEGDDE